jgi:hypothetical protein
MFNGPKTKNGPNPRSRVKAVTKVRAGHVAERKEREKAAKAAKAAKARDGK